MKRAFFRLLTVVLILAFLLPNLVGILPAQAAEDDLTATVEEQIRAFARSINQSNADESAAMALATHGITGRGRQLNVGQNHPLTAALLNAELGQKTLAYGCIQGVRVMQQLGMESVFVDGGCYWSREQKHYSAALYARDSDPAEMAIRHSVFIDYTGSINDYDSSMIWMVGSAEVHIYMTRISVEEDTVTYDVTVVVEDRFDFNTESDDSVPKEIASLIGSFLFREFNWTATARFTLTMPNSCTHAPSDYRWYYDPESGEMICDAAGGFADNQATRASITRPDYEGLYYEMDRTVLLCHDAPWVLEYTVADPGKFMIAPADRATTPYVGLLTCNRTHLFFQSTAFVNKKYEYDCYGYTLANLFAYNAGQHYTIRLENVIRETGGNRILLSVYNQDLDQQVLTEQPMDDYYKNLDGVLHLQDGESENLSGLDLRFSFIGNRSYPFAAGSFELKILENGVDRTSNAYLSGEQVAPTCHSRGYTTYTCRCGYSYNDCYEDALGHNYVNGTCTRCGEAKGWVGKVSRLSGENRYETAFAVADQLKENLGLVHFSTVIVANGQNFPDALTGSYLAAVKEAPILLTEPSKDLEVLDYLDANQYAGGRIYILGGTAAVSQAFEDEARSRGYDVKRLMGAGRYETNLEILKEAGVNTTDEILIATGRNYADSLSASATGLPMLLVDKQLTAEQKTFLETTSKKFVILGGDKAVSQEIEAELAAIGTVTRVMGASRYETSAAIAQRYFENPQAAVLAYAQNFPDGLCGGPLALSMGAPLILTSNESYAIADAYIEGIVTGAVTGGTARISDDTVRKIFDLPDDAQIVKP